MLFENGKNLDLCLWKKISYDVSFEQALKEMKSSVGTKKLLSDIHFDMWRVEIQFQFKLVLRNTQWDAGINKNYKAGNIIVKNEFRMQMDYHIHISSALASKTNLIG
jgi:hypothetical protein